MAVYVDQIFVGYVMAKRGTTTRTKHSAKLVIGIHEDYRVQGIVSLLLKEIIH
ncbi:hypothetical protein [Pontibacillus yanchengensis]